MVKLLTEGVEVAVVGTVAAVDSTRRKIHDEDFTGIVVVDRCAHPRIHITTDRIRRPIIIASVSYLTAQILPINSPCAVSAATISLLISARDTQVSK